MITPVRGGATFSQSLILWRTFQNDVSAAGATWTASGGTFSSQGSTTATYAAPNATGNVTVTATSVRRRYQERNATLAVTISRASPPITTTSHATGQHARVCAYNFQHQDRHVRQTLSCTVDGAIYGQPLWVANLAVNGAKRNVIVVTTQHDSV